MNGKEKWAGARGPSPFQMERWSSKAWSQLRTKLSVRERYNLKTPEHSLYIQPHPKLDNALGIRQDARNLSKRAAQNVCAWVAELRMVEDIEELRAEFQINMLT